jgi:hypothetical protein
MMVSYVTDVAEERAQITAAMKATMGMNKSTEVKGRKRFGMLPIPQV